MIYELIYIVIFISLIVFAFYIIISRFGDTSTNNMETDDTSSTVSYVPKKFLFNNEYNFLTKFIDLENVYYMYILSLRLI